MLLDIWMWIWIAVFLMRVWFMIYMRIGQYNPSSSPLHVSLNCRFPSTYQGQQRSEAKIHAPIQHLLTPFFSRNHSPNISVLTMFHSNIYLLGQLLNKSHDGWSGRGGSVLSTHYSFMRRWGYQLKELQPNGGGSFPTLLSVLPNVLSRIIIVTCIHEPSSLLDCVL